MLRGEGQVAKAWRRVCLRHSCRRSRLAEPIALEGTKVFRREAHMDAETGTSAKCGYAEVGGKSARTQIIYVALGRL